MIPSTRSDLSALPAYIPGTARPGAVKLASNETTAGPLPSVRAAIELAATDVNRYPDNGSAALVAALADRLGVGVNQVAAGCGSVALCQSLMQITCHDGDEVLFAWRSFEAYPLLTTVVGATPVQVPLTAGKVHDLDAMARAITDRTRVIFVCNPNNPTGTVVGRVDLEAFLDRVPAHILVVLDEAYVEYIRSDRTDVPDGVQVARTHPNVAVLRTFSKAYGLAGLRVGYCVAHPSVIAALKKVHIPFSVNSLAQAAAIASLGAAAELLARTEEVVAERRRVRAALLEAGYEVPPTEANFVWISLGADTIAFAQACAESGVLIRPFAGDGARVTVTNRAENDAFLAFAAGASARRFAGHANLTQTSR